MRTLGWLPVLLASAHAQPSRAASPSAATYICVTARGAWWQPGTRDAGGYDENAMAYRPCAECGGSATSFGSSAPDVVVRISVAFAAT